jgi:epoxyqueuosine reductase
MQISTSDSPDLVALRRELVARALALGFDVAKITKPGSIPAAQQHLLDWLQHERQGDMQWMAERTSWRGDPTSLWPQAKSVLMLGLNYGPDEDPLVLLTQRDHAAISVYARHRDYHDVIKSRLKKLARWLVEQSGAEVKVFVDTAPVMEKPLAEASGLGWQGKHTNLVSREFGSWLFLGSIFTTLEFEPDEREQDHCGQCSRCLDICPTNAFPAPYQLDARRCISYLTIEYDGHIPLEFRKLIGNRIYGCDDCLAVCPWNKFAQSAREISLQSRADLRAPLLAELAKLDDKNFRSFFSGSPVKRIGRNRFLRNVMIAIGNSANKSLVQSALLAADDPSPLVRGAAIWAIAELDRDCFLQMKTTGLAGEQDEHVRGEWMRL